MKNKDTKISPSAARAKKIFLEVLRYLFFILFLAALGSLVYFVRNLKGI